jgi:protein-L-isoaspartate(D-aspartate) O-methyltransferase
MSKYNFKQRRHEMVEKQLKGRDIVDEKVLDAMGKVEREKFLPKDQRHLAYADHPVPIGYDQTISQPYIVALMCQLLELKGDEVIMDIGTGLGYQAAVLAQLAKKVVTIEIVEELGQKAEENLAELGYQNVKVVIRNGKEGFQKAAPYDGIKVAAATRKIPDAWKDQLKDGGRIVLPLKKGRWSEDLVRLTKDTTGFKEESFGAVAFVPLVDVE